MVMQIMFFEWKESIDFNFESDFDGSMREYWIRFIINISTHKTHAHAHAHCKCYVDICNVDDLFRWYCWLIDDIVDMDEWWTLDLLNGNLEHVNGLSIMWYTM